MQFLKVREIRFLDGAKFLQVGSNLLKRGVKEKFLIRVTEGFWKKRSRFFVRVEQRKFFVRVEQRKFFVKVDQRKFFVRVDQRKFVVRVDQREFLQEERLEEKYTRASKKQFHKSKPKKIPN
jgi:hypothetical protein